MFGERLCLSRGAIRPACCRFHNPGGAKWRDLKQMRAAPNVLPKKRMPILWVLFLLAADNPGIEARYATDAALLFQDGQARLQAGKYGTAKLAFQALISVYPESPLVDQARDAMRRCDQLEQRREHTAVVRSIRFEKLPNVSADEVLQRFREQEVGLMVESRCHRRDVDEAKTVLADLLAEKGVAHPRVKVVVRKAAGQHVEITFRPN